eukprot:CAMPEP_0204259158 /NCGR_PEP_ID=MMETSP0468-20130131/5430_1 /ASSEMBLY_ACC=CAM_ASM_000383 /TAXON_ID=2969 /ORGANISM="Oxyrrhis marina" /LENGTH=32 /DNA_ID= /DNA_START= /DNA_END= /DNA_ORIENTATION=
MASSSNAARYRLGSMPALQPWGSASKRNPSIA